MHNVLPRYQAGSLQFLGDTVERGMEAEIENEKAVVVGRDGVEMDMKDGSAKQRFSYEPDLSPAPSPSPSSSLSDEADESRSEGYWEVEDVWEEDSWLRGDGEDGMESLSSKRGIIPRRSGDFLRFNLSEDDINAKTTPSDLMPLKISLPSFSSPSTPVSLAPRRGLPDVQDDSYFLDIFGAPRRSKSTTNLLTALGHVPDRNFSNSRSLFTTPFSSSLGSSSRSSSCVSRSVMPSSTPNVEVDSSLTSRLCTLPSWMSTSGDGDSHRFARLKSPIVSVS